jgi:hypothetical protein
MIYSNPIFDTLIHSNSVLGVVTNLRTGRFGVRIPAGVRDLSLPENVHIAPMPTQPQILWAPGVRRPAHEADHSPEISTKVTIEWSHMCT